jgi:gas vesicle protein GvpK
MTKPHDLRIDLDPEAAGRGLAGVLLALMDAVHQLLERQAIRRLEAQELTDQQIETVGAALRDIRIQLDAVRAALTTPGVAELPTPHGKDSS